MSPRVVGFVLLALVDAAVVVGAMAAALAVKLHVLDPQGLDVAAHLDLWPLLPVFTATFASLGLYRQSALGRVEELKRSVQGLSLGFLLVAGLSFLAKVGAEYSRAVFIVAWALAVVVLPLLRPRVRTLLARIGWYGHPVAILGGGLTGRMIIRALRRDVSLGLRPVVVLDDGLASGICEGVPVAGSLERAKAVAQERGLRHAIVAMPGASSDLLRRLESANREVYPHLFVVPNICGFVASGVSGRDLGGVLGLQVRRNLLLRTPRAIKRFSDLLLSLVLAIPMGALVLLLALAIKLDSPGPVFFGHARIGRGGRTFKAWKFRSMVSNSKEVLERLLAESPEARAEWAADHKLRNDPRVTRVGKFLRLTSLDELPQAWNVLWGEMSFIGPRPIVADEIAKYGEVIEMYHQVRPGISGLWQVSGRNDTTYEERVGFDDYYVRNWSVWLDLHILIRTVKVVLFGKGAY